MFSMRASRPKFARMASTLVGRSGHRYSRQQKIRTHPNDSEKDVYVGFSERKGILTKPVSKSVFELAQELRDVFENNSRIRTHIDETPEKDVLVYEVRKSNLLHFVMMNADIPVETKRFVLRQAGLALRDLHSKGWVHLDVKPEHVLLDWDKHANRIFRVKGVVLGDLDSAQRLPDGEVLANYTGGNVKWRSPEGLAGKGIGKPSDVFSFGLMCMHAITGTELNLTAAEKSKEDDIELEYIMLSRLLSNFGPLPPGLITHVNDEWWGELMTKLCQYDEDEGQTDRFEQWDETKFPNLNSEVKRFILRMCHLDPKKRATMHEIMEDQWWNPGGHASKLEDR